MRASNAPQILTRRLPHLVAGFAILTAGSVIAASSVIDDFSDGFILLQTDPTTDDPVSGSAIASVAGGVRQVDLVINTTGQGPARVVVDPTSVFIDAGLLDMNANRPGFELTLTYDGGGLGLTNTPSGGDYGMFNEFQITFDFLNLAGGSLLTGITVTDADSNSDTVALLLTTDVPDGAPVTYSFPFSSLTGIDFNRLDQIVVTFDTGMDLDVDFRISGITAIPEPTAASLLALALVGVVARRRRAAT